MTDTPDNAYRVLARKYRPRNFDELIGQDAMVRTLSNAIKTGRLAHAFILTGVRGIGKTTTARIIAKALNCTGPDGNGGPTIQPCGICDNCQSIADSRHVDVMEMDAASHTGVDDIREIIDGVRYAAVSARFKIYIIDEVHMLSRNAFNALLKTLEEPPEHVKFIFATTEIRKVPVTVLSRCQRFDLRRISADELVLHFSGIAEKEDCKIEQSSLKMIARAAEGSVRDGLSLLDQAFAHGAGTVDDNQVRDMLGLADRAQVLDLFRATMKGDVPTALSLLRQQYDYGADPAVILQDMLDLTHWLTRLKVVPDAGEDLVTSEAEREEGGTMAQSLSVPHLTRAWQMLLKGLNEVRNAPASITAAEMVLVRLAYIADLPSPGDLVKQIQNNPATMTNRPATDNGGGQGGNSGAPSSQTNLTGQNSSTPQEGGQGITASFNLKATSAVSGNLTTTPASLSSSPQAQLHVAASQPLTASPPEITPSAAPKLAEPKNFDALLALFEAMQEPNIAYHLRDNTHLVDFKPGRLDIRLKEKAPRDLPGRITHCLQQWLGRRWIVSLSQDEGADSRHKQDTQNAHQLREKILQHPDIKKILSLFPEADITDIQSRHERELAEQTLAGLLDMGYVDEEDLGLND
ncbi:MAG: DNA polymerase III subunit gamma/tau [Kordiimonas sp.]|nr:DNA polymerase III subunit gamma/tau [Kordiimonas sp.]